MRKHALLLSGFVAMLASQTAPAQFVAYNDHFSGPNTHPNATTWNVFGTEGGAPGNAGPLKDIATGQNLPVTLTINNSGATGGTTAAGPAPGTPAYNTFNQPANYIDWGSGTVNNAILVGPSAVVSHVFTGLNPAKRYIFKGTGVRGGGYLNRWTIFELAEATSFTSAHTANALTSAQYPASLAANQVAINTGQNDAVSQGDMAVWENIDPGPDGSFTVLSKQYLGPIPSGTAGEAYGYGLAALRLEEFNPTPTPVSFTIQPQNRTVNEFQSANFSVLAAGNPSPILQWYRVEAGVTNPIPNATNNSYTIAAASPSDNGARFFVMGQNTVTGVLYTAFSSSAVLSVIVDTNPPALVTVYASFSLNTVTLLFTEPLTEATATNLGNYLITNAASGQPVSITKAVLQPNLSNVVLTTSLLTNGATYNVVVNGIADRSAAANQVAPNSMTNFVAQSSFSVSTVGGASPSATWLPFSTGGDLSSGGLDIGLAGTSDQFGMASQTRSGDFDLQVRVASISISDPWAKAGLMARSQPLNNNGTYAAALASPDMNGCFFQARTTSGTAAISSGSFPVNFPYTWLRLQRTNTTNFISYASPDGLSWVTLGRAPIVMNDPVAVGFVLSSHANGVPATAQFRDFGDAKAGSAAEVPLLSTEPLGPSSRRTGLVISEIMYHPGRGLSGTNTNSLEYIEIYNSQPFFEPIGGYRVSGSVHYTFPSNTVIGGGSFLVVARDPAYLSAYYGLTNVLGPWFANETAEKTNDLANNNLPDDSGTVRLRNRQGAVLLEVNYQTKASWPIAPDATGHSLVLARPSYGEGDPQAWAASARIGGSPGRYEPTARDPLQNVMINEFLANTANTSVEDFIELYNHGNQPVNLSGAWLSDDAETNKFRIPDPTILGPTSCVVFARSILGFGLDANNGRIFLVNSNVDRVLDALRYEGQARGVSMGRYPDGAPDFRELKERTPGASNGAFLQRDIVINEIMYSPISGSSDDEYIELYNRGTNSIDLLGWKFDDGITFTFTNSTIIPPNGYLVVAKNKIILKSKYNNLNESNLAGNYEGTLANGGERLALAMAEYSFTTNSQGQVTTNVTHIVVNEVAYKDGGRWGVWSDGGGSSLELIDPHSDNRLPSNWADSDETQKSTWTSIDFTGPIGETLGSPINDNVHIYLLGVGECLVDDVRVISGANNVVLNSDFESGMTNWFPQGSLDLSSIEPVGFSGSQSLHLRAGSRGDAGGNRIRSANWVPISGQVTIHAQARWLRGWPELLVRLHGGGAEATGRLTVPSNLGTPGAPNSRLIGNAGPAMWEVKHAPILPMADEPVRVMARAYDPDGLSSLALRYRLDPDPNYQSLTLVDDGTGGDAVAGDGVFTATLSGRAAGTIVAFYMQAVDTLGMTNLFPQDVFPTAPLVRVFPNDALLRECVIRWGEVQMPGSFGTYHLWLTQTNIDRWYNRDHLNNALLDGTFVYNNCRVIYNALPNFAGSPWHRGQMTTGPVGAQSVDYVQSWPVDDRFLGTTDSVLCNPGNPGGTSTSDNSAQTEQASYLIFNELGLHYNYRRYIHYFVNGSQRSKNSSRAGNFILEDAQQPNADAVEEWFPDDTDGDLFKIEDWFEFNDNGYDFSSNNDADLSRRTIVIGNSTNLYVAPYRYMFRRRAYGPGDSVNDYRNFFAIVDAISPAANPNGSPIPNPELLNAIINGEQWMRVFACQHAVGNWDSYGFGRGKNDYMYKPVKGRFAQMTWDIDFTMGVGGNAANDSIWTGITDPRLAVMLTATPLFTRAYLRAMEEIVNGPMNNSFMDPILDAKQAALLANNINVDPAVVTTIKTYVSDRRANLLSQISAATTAPFALSGPSSFETNGNIITISGSAPVKVEAIRVNGVEYPVTWSGAATAPTTWTLKLCLGLGTNNFVIQGLDLTGNLVANSTTNVTINYTGPGAPPEGTILFNEIMYHPAIAQASYVEILNTSTNFTFDLSGWRLNGLGGYTFPGGTFLTNRQYLILAKDRTAFATAYGGAIPVFDTYDGELQGDGETLTLTKPAFNSTEAEVIIDKVRYEAARPWPDTAPGTSVQLVDTAQDNARVGNWRSGSIWRYYSFTTNSGTAAGTLYLIPLNAVSTNGCDLYLDDLRLVFGTNAAAGNNLLRNADFETGNASYWSFRSGATNSHVTNSLFHGGTYSLHMVASGGGNINFAISQLIQGYVANSNYTLSYWYLSGTNVVGLTAQIGDLRVRFTAVNNNLAWVPSTPGAANSIMNTLPAFPPLWLNEVQAENLHTRSNRFGQFTPWVELYNAGTNTLDLTGYYLANNYLTNMLQWAFPTGSLLNAGEFKVIWLDGADTNSIPEELHANFTLPPRNGSIALVRTVNSLPQVVDYLNYWSLGASLSYGAYPDGQPFSRQIFFNVTPGGTNDAQRGMLSINEWVAQNVQNSPNGIPGFPNPAGGGYDDWFEIYNPNPFLVNLNNYYLTDTTNNKVQFKIPSGYSVPANGFLVVWADGSPSRNTSGNSNLHVNFNLARGGEQIALYDPNTNLLDAVTFGSQTNNISQGRYGDGAPEPFFFMANPTPGAPNMWFENHAPALLPIADLVITQGQTLTVTTVANDPDALFQTLTYHLGPNAPAGSAISPSGVLSWFIRPDQAGPYAVTVWVEDNGLPRLSATNVFNVLVVSTNTGGNNTAPVLAPIPQQNVAVGQLLSFTVSATDTDTPPQALTFSLEPGAPEGAGITPGGLFTWTPLVVGSSQITVRVTDNGVPPLSTTGTFTVVVSETITPQRLSILRQGPDLVVSWPETSARLSLQYTLSLGFDPTANWQNYTGPITTNAGTISVTLPVTTNQFFRLVK